MRDELITCLTRVLAEEVDCQVGSLLVEEVATGGHRSQEKRRCLNVFQRVFEPIKDNLDSPRVPCLVLKCTLDVNSFGYKLCLTVKVNSVSALSSVALDCLGAEFDFIREFEVYLHVLLVVDRLEGQGVIGCG